jgi:hypothetical protein
MIYVNEKVGENNETGENDETGILPIKLDVVI